MEKHKVRVTWAILAPRQARHTRNQWDMLQSRSVKSCFSTGTVGRVDLREEDVQTARDLIGAALTYETLNEENKDQLLTWASEAGAPRVAAVAASLLSTMAEHLADAMPQFDTPHDVLTWYANSFASGQA